MVTSSVHPPRPLNAHIHTHTSGESIVASRLNWSHRHLLDLVFLASVWRFKEASEAFAASHLICNTHMLYVHDLVTVDPLASYVSYESASFYL